MNSSLLLRGWLQLVIHPRIYSDGRRGNSAGSKGHGEKNFQKWKEELARRSDEKRKQKEQEEVKNNKTVPTSAT